MCTETFLRLPEEKRNRFLEAAWEEFSSVPFEKVSINKIVLRAKIPRGSFYQYFAGKEDLFETALDNSSAYDRATLFDLSEVFQSATGDCENLLESSTAAPLPASLYVLSNEDSFFGAAALFYPGMLERLTILIGGAFYVLPSSIHEVLVLPVTGGDAQKLADIIKTANRTVTDSDVFLADDLFVCEAGRLRQVSYSGMIPRSGVLPC